MSQYWGPPNYPPRPPQYRYQLPPPDYDNSDQNETRVRRALYFLGGSCLTAIVLGSCMCVLVLLWVIDARFGITSGSQVANSGVISTPLAASANPAVQTDPTQAAPQQPVQPDQPLATPVPDQPMAIGQPIAANDIGLELTVFDIQREVQPNNLAPAEGMEFVAVSIQLLSTPSILGSKPYSVANFQLQDVEGNLYPPDLTAENGRRLADGALADNASTEGDLLFHIPLGRAPLVLVWTPANSVTFYSVALQ